MPLKLIIGPMFAGKTTALFVEVEKSMAALKSVVVVKHSSDKRYDHMFDDGATALITRGGNKLSSGGCCKVVLAASLRDVFDDLLRADMIAISEVQFYPDAVEVIKELVIVHEKRVVCEGLSGDYMQKPFEQVSCLVSLANRVKTLRAVCMICRVNEAPYTARRDGIDGERVVVGSDDIYLSVCEHCLGQRVK
jgi:thymidine kinase